MLRGKGLLNVITEIPFDFSQKDQTVPRPNRRSTVYFGTQLISVGSILLIFFLNVGPANRPAFFRQVPLFFYAKCPSKNILQVLLVLGNEYRERDLCRRHLVDFAASSDKPIDAAQTWLSLCDVCCPLYVTLHIVSSAVADNKITYWITMLHSMPSLHFGCWPEFRSECPSLPIRYWIHNNIRLSIFAVSLRRRPYLHSSSVNRFAMFAMQFSFFFILDAFTQRK